MTEIKSTPLQPAIKTIASRDGILDQNNPDYLHQVNEVKLFFLYSGLFLSAALQNSVESFAGETKLVFQDNFDGQLADGWNWIRPNPAHWNVCDGNLQIRVVPGRADTVKNALVRQAPPRSEASYAIDVTVANDSIPTEQWEQAGITWYQNGKPIFKLVKELVDGKAMIIPGRKLVDSQTVDLRLVVTADSYTALYREKGKKDFQVAASGKLPPGKNEQVSIQCYHGPPDAEHWMIFSDFRIQELAEDANSQGALP